MADKKVAVYCGSRNIYGDMETAAKSLVANSDVDEVWFVIEDDEFPTKLPDIVHCVNVSGQTWFPPEGACSNTRYTYMTLMRVALCHILPDTDRVLSLDSDTVCVGDASHVWELPVDRCYFAATPEIWAKQRPGLMYCNVGVTLFNLAKLRDGKADECIDALNAQWFSWPDQDVLNYLCQGHIGHMPSGYNSCPWVVDDHSPVRIVHFAARDDWRNEPEVRKWRETSWDEVMSLHRQKVMGDDQA